jgi:mono/diheme cytochrome c family protein
MSRSPFSKSAISQSESSISASSESALSESLLSKVTRERFRLRLTLLAWLAASLVALCSGVPNAASQTTARQKNDPQRQSATIGGAGDVARGKYLVESVVVCGQCHTPRDSEGNPDPRRWLQGGPVPYQSATPNSDWPQMVPRIGGTPPGTDADMVKLLTTGIWNTGARLRLPMPQFRMDVGDAQAVVAYLKTVKPQP